MRVIIPVGALEFSRCGALERGETPRRGQKCFDAPRRERRVVTSSRLRTGTDDVGARAAPLYEREPPSSDRRTGYAGGSHADPRAPDPRDRHYRKKSWFENLGDIFD
jgi:hypothetical protein